MCNSVMLEDVSTEKIVPQTEDKCCEDAGLCQAIYPKENISGQRPPYPEPEEENSKSAAAITENQLDASGRSSSERSSGDGEESLYATIRYLSAGKM